MTPRGVQFDRTSAARIASVVRNAEARRWSSGSRRRSEPHRRNARCVRITASTSTGTDQWLYSGVEFGPTTAGDPASAWDDVAGGLSLSAEIRNVREHHYTGGYGNQFRDSDAESGATPSLEPLEDGSVFVLFRVRGVWCIDGSNPITGVCAS